MSDHDPARIPARLGHVDLPDQDIVQTVNRDVQLVLGPADTRIRDSWANVLSRYNAHAFVTLTFRPQRFYRDKWSGQVRAADRVGHNGSVHPELADKAFRVFVSKINGSIWGRSWSKRWHGGCQWVRGTEFHLDGRLHLHALVAAPTDDLWCLTRIRDHHVWWREEFGFNRIERPRSQRDVQDYVADYVVKDGLLDFSRNFGHWAPPKLNFAAAVQQPLVGGGAEVPTPGD